MTGAHGIVVLADRVFDADILEPADDFLILPGGMPGALNLRNCEPLCNLLIEHNRRNAPIAAICAAPFVLGELGILQGRKATCYPGFEGKLTGAVVTGNHVECDANVVTANGPAASMDFAFSMVERMKGNAVVNALREAMMFV